MEASKLGLYFDEFVVGETVEHALSKTIFESDNNFFSLLTMNHHPVHTNLDYARKNQHGQLLVVGTLVFSLVVGMTVDEAIRRLKGIQCRNGTSCPDQLATALEEYKANHAA